MRICLFEDETVVELEPVSLTRPVFELRCGRGTLGDIQRHYFRHSSWSSVIRPYLVDIFRFQHPSVPVNDSRFLTEEPVVFVNGRWIPPENGFFDPSSSPLGEVNGELAYLITSPNQIRGVALVDLFVRFEELRKIHAPQEVGGKMAHHLWDLVSWNGEQIIRDWKSLAEGTTGGEMIPSGSAPALVGPAEHLVCHPSVQIDPMVVIDTRQGPVFLERDVIIGPFSRIEGPAVVGTGTQLQGINLRGGTTLGPQCRMGGEVEASIVQGYSNKYHDGFLGHSYLGEWINLGAGTQISDLRNDYGEIRVHVHGRLVRTCHNKIGSFLGDHTKSAIGTLLNTGTNAGIFSALLPGGLLPRWIPSYCSYRDHRLAPASNGELLLATAQKVMNRRGCEFTSAHDRLYWHLFDLTASERQKAIRNETIERYWRSA